MSIVHTAIVKGLTCFILLASPFYLMIAFFPSVGNKIGKILLWLPYIAMFSSGIVTAYYSRRSELLNSTIIGIITAITLALINYLWSAAGLHSDLSGLKGSVWIAVLSLPITISLCIAGGVCMIVVRRILLHSNDDK